MFKGLPISLGIGIGKICWLREAQGIYCNKLR
ncbi:hypothetical protein SAMN00808754_1048 [Thermanaeromonas toyohensis ToBE]|uniref:Uncharacterized protein n=1 Tax=Thermanaeromonas toyohensis ToBE TaxID=698762 RepID=A0A1W1VMQ8_9FIRM|nr:hypothetical protein SAMN00808754_1048 [Thermanaeromonas toyohensis ToBE]